MRKSPMQKKIQRQMQGKEPGDMASFNHTESRSFEKHVLIFS